MTSTRAVGAVIALLAGALGCAPSSSVVSSSPRSATSPAPIARSTLTEELTCPETIAASPPLEAPSFGVTQARTWVKRYVPEGLDLTKPTEEKFRLPLPLRPAPLEVVGVSRGGGATVVVLQPQAEGACVVNSWGTVLPGKTDLTLAASWVSADQRRAVLLVKLQVPAPDDGAIQTHWVVLATDGNRVWQAFETPPNSHLLAPQVSLRPQSGKLYLDVQIHQTTVFVLRENGLFDRLN